MTTLREELERLADEPWPHGGPRYGRTELALAAANLALTRYAEKMERAGQPAAALGAILMAEQECGTIRAMRVG